MVNMIKYNIVCSIACIFLGLAGASSNAVAQVYKCTDIRGEIIYSDAPCGTGATGAMLEGKKAADELARERESAAQALERKYQQRAQENRASPEEVRPVLRPDPAPSPANSMACAEARKELAFVSGIRTIPQDEKRVRVNAAIAQVNAGCGTQTPLMQEPDKLIIDTGRDGTRPQ